MLSINLLKKQYELQNYFKIIVTGLLFGFSITDASAQVVQKLDKIHLQLIQRRY
jgi:hypothetical protein